MKEFATRDALGYQLPLMGEKFKNIIALSADLGGATRLNKFKEKFPERFFDIGIAEANMIGIASGLSEHGFKVFLASFSSFLTGRYDIIRCSIAYSNCPVVLVGTHVGLAIGRDGVSQMGLEDVSLMRSLPNMKILNQATYSEAIAAITYLCETELDSPHYLRLGRQPVKYFLEQPQRKFEFNKAYTVKEGENILIFSTGCILGNVRKAANIIENKYWSGSKEPTEINLSSAVQPKSDVSVRVVNFHTLKPIDKETILKSADEFGTIYTVEDHSIIGGLGSIVSEVIAESGKCARVVRIGLNDVFPESGPPDKLYEKYGLSPEKIVERIVNDRNNR